MQKSMIICKIVLKIIDLLPSSNIKHILGAILAVFIILPYGIHLFKQYV